MKLTAFWDMAPPWEGKALMVEAVRTSESRFTSTRPHGAIYYKAVFSESIVHSKIK
jgi:hypothetical protein